MNAEIFTAVRNFLQLSQVEYANALGVASSTVSMTEVGLRKINDKLVSKVALLDVDMDEVTKFMERRDALSRR